jgi:hypothetical protein
MLRWIFDASFSWLYWDLSLVLPEPSFLCGRDSASGLKSIIMGAHLAVALQAEFLRANQGKPRRDELQSTNHLDDAASTTPPQ